MKRREWNEAGTAWWQPGTDFACRIMRGYGCHFCVQPHSQAFDEPSGALDIGIAEQTWAELEGLA